MLINYNVEHTLSSKCNGQIWSVDVSGNTSVIPPYSVSWSGSSDSYTADTFDIINLCEGWYKATITDSIGNTGSTELQISGFTVPVIEANLSNDDCVLNTNKLGQISVIDSTTTTSSFRYELVKNGRVVDTHYGTTADTRHTFSSITNGVYTVSVIEDRPMNTNLAPDNSGCTPYNYNDGNNGMSTAGWNLNTLSSTTISWVPYVPNAPYDQGFLAGWGPNGGGSATEYYDTGLAKDGKVYSSNPYVWFYTGATASRLTDTSADWYLGEAAIDMTEGGNLGPVTLAASAANIGKFYYNTVIEKYLYWWPAQGAGYAWRTLDPRDDYGIFGSPVAVSGLTGITYGVTIEDVTSNDFSVNSGGTVAVATGIVLEGGSSQLYTTSGNNSAPVGKQSLCSYYNYNWEFTFRSGAADDDTIAFTIASFRDDRGKYGPTGVTYTIDVVMTASSDRINVVYNHGQDAYAWSKYKTPTFRNCNGGCPSSAPDFGITTIISNTGAKTPFTSGTNWSSMGATRVRCNRYGDYGQFFRVEFTDTMANVSGGAITKGNGDANPFNSDYTIDFNLLDKTTWVGNNDSAPEWADNYGLCKFLGSRKIGFWSNSQDDARFYHMQFTGNSFNEYMEGPICGVDNGPTTTVGITASTATTVNINNTKCRPKYNTTQKGVPQVRPTVNVSLQTMPNPSLTINGLSRPTTTISTEIGGRPALEVYNLENDKGKNIQFYFGGNNQDMIFENMYPKFRVYPYIFETEQVAPLADYEAIFDTMPAYMDSDVKSIIFSAETFMPFSGLSTDSSWEFIIRPSYLYKDKKSTTDTWVDTAEYPTDTDIDAGTDFYMVLVKNPPTPQLFLDSFNVPVDSTPPTLRIETYKLISGSGDLPETSASTYSSSTFYYNLQQKPASRPLVSVNGVILKEGRSGTTIPDGYNLGDPGQTEYGDYYFYENTRSVIFHPETVQNGDDLQFLYDTNGGVFSQFVTIPETVSTDTTEKIYEENEYYYINLDRQSIGAITVAINGVLQYDEKDYVKFSDNKIQLLHETSTYSSGDTIVLFYKTIYQVISSPITKNPVIPVTYVKNNNLEEEIIVRLFDSTGNLVQELTETIDVDMTGNMFREFTLLPPNVDSYYYYVLIRRYYPLIGGQTITTESQTDTINFVIDRNVFYSPNRNNTSTAINRSLISGTISSGGGGGGGY